MNVKIKFLFYLFLLYVFICIFSIGGLSYYYIYTLKDNKYLNVSYNIKIISDCISFHNFLDSLFNENNNLIETYLIDSILIKTSVIEKEIIDYKYINKDYLNSHLIYNLKSFKNSLNDMKIQNNRYFIKSNKTFLLIKDLKYYLDALTNYNINILKRNSIFYKNQLGKDYRNLAVIITLSLLFLFPIAVNYNSIILNYFKPTKAHKSLFLVKSKRKIRFK